jgi:hypothetical protein
MHRSQTRTVLVTIVIIYFAEQAIHRISLENTVFLGKFIGCIFIVFLIIANVIPRCGPEGGPE